MQHRSRKGQHMYNLIVISINYQKNVSNGSMTKYVASIEQLFEPNCAVAVITLPTVWTS